MVSFLRLKRQCTASGDNYYAYSVATRPDEDHQVPCPVCGKVVQLRKFIGDKHNIRIPAHFKNYERNNKQEQQS
jgi:hypothetical protein